MPNLQSYTRLSNPNGNPAAKQPVDSSQLTKSVLVDSRGGGGVISWDNVDSRGADDVIRWDSVDVKEEVIESCESYSGILSTIEM